MDYRDTWSGSNPGSIYKNTSQQPSQPSSYSQIKRSSSYDRRSDKITVPPPPSPSNRALSSRHFTANTRLPPPKTARKKTFSSSLDAKHLEINSNATKIFSQTSDNFIREKACYFLGTKNEREDAFAGFAKLINDYPLQKQIQTLKDLVSYLDSAGETPLSQQVYSYFGDFYFEHILSKQCNKLHSLPPKEASVLLVSLYYAMRNLLDFRGRKILLDQKKDCFDSIPTILLSLAKSHSLCDLRYPLLVLAKREDPIGFFFKKLFLEGRLASKMVIGTTPHPALDLAAYAFLFLDQTEGIDWLHKLETEEQSSYSKAFILPVTFPSDLYDLLQTKITANTPEAKVFEEVIEHYKLNLNDQQLEERRRREEKLQKIYAHIQFFIPSVKPHDAQLSDSAIPVTKIPHEQKPLLHHISVIKPVVKQSTDKILSLGNTIAAEPKSLEELKYSVAKQASKIAPKQSPAEKPVLPIAQVKDILKQINTNQRTRWPECLECLQKTASNHPEKKEKDLQDICLTLIRAQWSDELKNLIADHNIKLTQDFWDKFLANEKTEAKKILTSFIFLAKLFDPENDSEKNLAFTMYDQILTHLPQWQDRTLHLEEGRLAAQLCQILFPSIKNCEIDSPMFEGFVTLTAYQYVNKKKKQTAKSILESLPAEGNSIFTHNLQRLLDEEIEPNSQLLISRGALFNKVCQNKKPQKVHEELIKAILLKHHSIFYDLLIEAKDKQKAEDFIDYLKKLKDPSLKELVDHETTQFPALINWNYCFLIKSKHYESPDIPTSDEHLNTAEPGKSLDISELSPFFIALFNKPSYLMDDDNRHRKDVAYLCEYIFEKILDTTSSTIEGDFLSNILLQAQTYKLFPIDVSAILKRLLHNPQEAHLHAALNVVLCFKNSTADGSPLVTFEMVSSLASKFTHHDTTSPSQVWCNDLCRLSHFIYQNFYLRKEKAERKQAKLLLGSLVEKILLTGSYGIENLFFFYRTLLRVGPEVSKKIKIPSLINIYKSAVDALQAATDLENTKNELALLRGRLVYYFHFKKENQEIIREELGGGQFRTLKDILADSQKMYKISPKKEIWQSKKSTRASSLKYELSLTDMLGAYFAHYVNDKDKNQIDLLLLWERFNLHPAIQNAFLRKEENEFPYFRIAYNQTSLLFGMALMTQQPSKESFLKALEILKATLSKGLNPNCVSPTVNLHTILINSCFEGPCLNLPIEERKIFLKELFDNRVVLPLPYNEIISQYILILTTITRKGSDLGLDESAFIIANQMLALDKISTRKFILDEWLSVAQKYRSIEFVDKIKSLYQTFLIDTPGGAIPTTP